LESILECVLHLYFVSKYYLNVFYPAQPTGTDTHRETERKTVQHQLE